MVGSYVYSLLFHRKVMVPQQSYLDARGGDQPGRHTLVAPTPGAAGR